MPGIHKSSLTAANIRMKETLCLSPDIGGTYGFTKGIKSWAHSFK